MSRGTGQRSGRARGAGKPKLAVWKFSSCDGCQMSLIDCEDQLLALARKVEIAYFPEVTRHELKGPYDLSLVEGSITTPHEAERIYEVRRASRALVAIGACATGGGVQALRNGMKVGDLARMVYDAPEYIETLPTSTPIADHVAVDYELRGCPVNKRQLLEVILSFLEGRRPTLLAASLCLECKRRGLTCLVVASGQPCLGPVTHAGCGAICPSFHRGCYGCYGLSEAPNVPAVRELLARAGLTEAQIDRELRRFNPAAPASRPGGTR
jgi:coenzyme F420-reducing hydrogenase gamma subunit